MKSFSKSFFALFFTIFLLSSKSAMATISSLVAITVNASSNCAVDATGGPCNIDLLCPGTSFSSYGFKINSRTSIFCTINADLKAACASDCGTATGDLRIAADAAAYKAKLDPMGDAKYDIQDQTFSRAMCQALKVVTGSAGKTFAAFAIIATGIGFFTGKVSWGLMIGVTAGIATMFGAPSIVAAISGQDTEMRCSNITR